MKTLKARIKINHRSLIFVVMVCLVACKAESEEEAFEKIEQSIKKLTSEEHYLISPEKPNINVKAFSPKDYYAAYKLSFGKFLDSKIRHPDSMLPSMGQIRLSGLDVYYNICGDIMAGGSVKTKNSSKNEIISSSIPIGFSTIDGLRNKLQDGKCYRKCVKADCDFWGIHEKHQLNKTKRKEIIFYFTRERPLFAIFPEKINWRFHSLSNGLEYDFYFENRVLSSTDEVLAYFDDKRVDVLEEKVNNFLPEKNDIDELWFNALKYGFIYLN